MTYNSPSRQPLAPLLAARLTDSDLRRVAGLALLNLGYVTAARGVLAGGPMEWPSIQQARRMTVRTRLWWISLDADTLALLRMLLSSPDPRRTPLVIPAAA